MGLGVFWPCVFLQFAGEACIDPTTIDVEAMECDCWEDLADKSAEEIKKITCQNEAEQMTISYRESIKIRQKSGFWVWGSRGGHFYCKL